MLTAFLAVYLVAVGHVSPTVAALGVAVRLGAGLAGDVILIRLLERRDSRRVMRASVPLALGLFPAFLLVPGIGPKLALLALLTVATAPWYPVLAAELYGSLPGHSGLAVSLTSVASLVGALGPLIVGVLAQRIGLGWAMASLCVVPVRCWRSLAVTAGYRLAAAGGPSTRIGSRDYLGPGRPRALRAVAHGHVPPRQRPLGPLQLGRSRCTTAARWCCGSRTPTPRATGPSGSTGSSAPLPGSASTTASTRGRTSSRRTSPSTPRQRSSSTSRAAPTTATAPAKT